jgi:hypothetical protein
LWKFVNFPLLQKVVFGKTDSRSGAHLVSETFLATPDLPFYIEQEDGIRLLDIDREIGGRVAIEFRAFQAAIHRHDQVMPPIDIVLPGLLHFELPQARDC